MSIADPFAMAADMLDPADPPYMHRPVEWVRERLGEFVWSKQQEIMESVRDNRFTAVKSCHESGKSHIASRIASWWIDQHPPGEAFVVSTAPSWPQVRAILWRYINESHGKAALAGRVNQTEWFITASGQHYQAPKHGELICGYGRKPADDDMTGFQGIHAKYVLVVLDEACGIPKALWDAVDTLVANTHSRVLAIGNPDDPDSHFATVCKPGSPWNVITISAFDTPNFTDEYVPDALRDLLVSELWVQERKQLWGELSPLYIAKVLGEFPENRQDTVVPLSYVRRAADPERERLKQQGTQWVQIGVDVGAGGDETVIRERRGVKIGRVWRYHTPDPMDAVGKIVEAIRETGANMVTVDGTGVGWGVAGRLKELGPDGERAHEADVRAVMVGAASSDSVRFKNLRAELWWAAREMCGAAATDELPEVPPYWDLTGIDEETISQLISVRYEHTSSGQVKIEPKEDVIERIGRSPDDADALILAFFVPPYDEEDHVEEYDGREEYGISHY